jgi:ankyrin repeat protein
VQAVEASRADCNASHPLGWTPLLLAVANGSTAIAQTLLENGADVNRPDNYQPASPQDVAQRKARRALAEPFRASCRRANPPLLDPIPRRSSLGR